MTDQHTAPDGEEPDVTTEGSFPDGAAEMADETQVEDPIDLPGDGGGDSAGGSDGGSESDSGSDRGSDELTLAQLALADRTSDLQRLQAEYLNYKRRVERDRDLIKENATYAALAPITEVLDTIDRAREHAVSSGGGLEGGFKAVAEQLERTVSTLGLTKFGEVGDAFDPAIHEALSHLGQDDDVRVTTCKVIAKAGYRIGSRVVRAAQVLVVDPA